MSSLYFQEFLTSLWKCAPCLFFVCPGVCDVCFGIFTVGLRVYGRYFVAKTISGVEIVDSKEFMAAIQ